MLKKLPVPIGDTIFREVCVNNYYVDKTLLIKDIIDEGAKVILFTRPRRFGKSLNMDMLKTFFEKFITITSFISFWKNLETITACSGCPFSGD